jgi:hypothetical protein
MREQKIAAQGTGLILAGREADIATHGKSTRRPVSGHPVSLIACVKTHGGEVRAEPAFHTSANLSPHWLPRAQARSQRHRAVYRCTAGARMVRAAAEHRRVAAPGRDVIVRVQPGDAFGGCDDAPLAADPFMDRLAHARHDRADDTVEIVAGRFRITQNGTLRMGCRCVAVEVEPVRQVRTVAGGAANIG